MTADTEARPIATRGGILQGIVGSITLAGLPTPESIAMFDASSGKSFADHPVCDLWFDRGQAEHLDRWVDHLVTEGARVDKPPTSDGRKRHAFLVHPCGWEYNLYLFLAVPADAPQVGA